MHSRRRPITGTTPVGVGITYIPLEPTMDDTTVSIIANGTVTFTLDSTVQNIMYDATAQAAVNIGNPNDRFVAPASAAWASEVASGSVSFVHNTANDNMISALRINITAGVAGSVTYTIIQG